MAGQGAGLNQDESEDKLVFHYSRARRLEHASEAVRALNDERSFRKIGLFRSLTANRASAFLLLAIILLCLMIFGITYLMPARNEAEYGANKLILSSFKYENAVYVALKKTRIRTLAYTGPVQAEIRAFQSKSDKEPVLVEAKELIFSKEIQEEFRFALKAPESGLKRIELKLLVGKADVVLHASVE